jgi:hypothetical protein
MAAENVGLKVWASKGLPCKALTPQTKAKQLIFVQTNKNRNWDNVIFTKRSQAQAGVPRLKGAVFGLAGGASQRHYKASRVQAQPPHVPERVWRNHQMGLHCLSHSGWNNQAQKCIPNKERHSV